MPFHGRVWNELPQSKPDGFDSSLGEGALGMAGRFRAKAQSLRVCPLPLGGAVAQRLRGYKSAEPEKTVKRSSRRTGVNLQFFPVEPTSLGLKGASSPFFVAPARRNRCDLAVLNAQHLLRKPVCDLKAPLGLSCLAGTAALFSLLVSKENIPRQAETLPAEAIQNRFLNKKTAALRTTAERREMECFFQAVTGLSSRSPRRAAYRPRRRGRHRRAPAGNRRRPPSVPRRSGRRCCSWAVPFWR